MVFGTRQGLAPWTPRHGGLSPALREHARVIERRVDEFLIQLAQSTRLGLTLMQFGQQLA